MISGFSLGKYLSMNDNKINVVQINVDKGNVKGFIKIRTLNAAYFSANIA